MKLDLIKTYKPLRLLNRIRYLHPSYRKTIDLGSFMPFEVELHNIISSLDATNDVKERLKDLFENYKRLYQFSEKVYAMRREGTTVYMRPSGLNNLLMRLSNLIGDFRTRMYNPYGWTNNKYWRFVNDVASKSADIIEERLERRERDKKKEKKSLSDKGP